MLGRDAHSVYQQLPLRSDQFRLMKLQHAPSRTHPIVASLFVEEFGAPSANYDAVSYTWGDAAESVNITINGCSLGVTRNLQVALQHLRREDKEVTLWVDSICINQADIVERNAQVARMDSIYSQAEWVRIWLGEASENSEKAMQLLNDCAEISGSYNVILRIIGDETGTRALTELLHRPYWTRMWVFQEIVLCHRATVHCGVLTAHWSTFRRLDKISGTPSQWVGLEIRKGWVLEFRKAFFRIAQFCIRKEEARHMTNVLQPTRRLQSADPRDKLFALLGVCDQSPFLAPDYSKSTRDIYMEFTRSFIRQDGDLSILLTAGPWNPENGENIDLPSWTPDYRGINGIDIRYLAASYFKYFDASKGRPLPLKLTEALPANSGSRNLVTQGVILDTITKCIPLGKGEAARRLVMEGFRPQRMGPHPTGRPQLEVLFQTMIFENAAFHNGQTDEERRVKGDTLLRLVLGFIHDFRKFHQHNSDTVCELDATTPEKTCFSSIAKGAFEKYTHLKTTDHDSLTWLREEFVLRVEEATDGNLTSIFSTTKSYLGRGLTTVQEGDLVAILFGCRLPVVLRRSCTGSSYHLISPCYVSGVMFGELMEKVNSHDSGGLKVEEVTLI